MDGKKGMKHYSAKIKREAVPLHLEKGITTHEIMEHLWDYIGTSCEVVV